MVTSSLYLNESCALSNYKKNHGIFFSHKIRTIASISLELIFERLLSFIRSVENLQRPITSPQSQCEVTCNVISFN